MKLSQLCATSRVRRLLNATSVHLVPTKPGRQPTKTRAVSSTGASSASARLQYGARGVSGPSASIKLSARLSPRALIRCPSRAASSSRVSYFSRVASSTSFNPRTRPSPQRAHPLLNLVRRPSARHQLSNPDRRSALRRRGSTVGGVVRVASCMAPTAARRQPGDDSRCARNARLHRYRCSQAPRRLGRCGGSLVLLARSETEVDHGAETCIRVVTFMCRHSRRHSVYRHG